jgi:type II secretory pathway pseudopilin PulG
MFKRNRLNQKGDTLVEVLIAIAIAAFAIGTSYAIANRSLQRAIAARERNEALNVAEAQISNLKYRYANDRTALKTIFKSDDPAKGFVAPSTFIASPPFPATAFHFCLLSANRLSDPNWARKESIFTTNADAENLSDTGGGGKYNPACKITTSTTDYFVDISAQVTSNSASRLNRTVYKVDVRWSELDGSGISTIYYRF